MKCQNGTNPELIQLHHRDNKINLQCKICNKCSNSYKTRKYTYLVQTITVTFNRNRERLHNFTAKITIRITLHNLDINGTITGNYYTIDPTSYDHNF